MISKCVLLTVLFSISSYANALVCESDFVQVMGEKRNPIETIKRTTRVSAKILTSSLNLRNIQVVNLNEYGKVSLQSSRNKSKIGTGLLNDNPELLNFNSYDLSSEEAFDLYTLYLPKNIKNQKFETFYGHLSISYDRGDAYAEADLHCTIYQNGIGNLL
jgi:hypothetical protein